MPRLIRNPELAGMLREMTEHEKRIAELFIHALGEEHVLECIKRQKELRRFGIQNIHHLKINRIKFKFARRKDD